MLIAFRSKLFDASGALPEGKFHGEDLAKWLAEHLDKWQSQVYAEDWGWEIVAKRDQYQYMFGVYDHDTNDVNENGPKWVVRLYNQRDHSNWLRKLFKYIPPVADKEVTQEIMQTLKQIADIAQIEIEQL
jgi:hypothetical protein